MKARGKEVKNCQQAWVLSSNRLERGRQKNTGRRREKKSKTLDRHDRCKNQKGPVDGIRTGFSTLGHDGKGCKEKCPGGNGNFKFETCQEWNGNCWVIDLVHKSRGVAGVDTHVWG